MKYTWVLAVWVTVLCLTGCDALSQPASQVLPTVVIDQAGPSASGTLTPKAEVTKAQGGVAASGKVVPAQQIVLASTAGGRLQAVKVVEGETVKAGQTLVQLAGSEKLLAAIEAANLELLSAQQAKKNLIEQAGKTSAAAQVRLANAQKALDDAQKKREWRNYRNGSQSQIDSARADYILASDALKRAEEQYSGFAASAEDDVNRASALNVIAGARRAKDKALANLNYLLSMPNTIELSQAEAELAAAKAEVESAQKELEKLKNGPDADALALIEVRIKNANALLTSNQTALSELELKAPFDGVVARLNFHSGEWVIPGQAILLLVDLSDLRVETTDLSERDVPRVKVGQNATVSVKALNTDLPGKVLDIATLADTLGGDVIYKTTLDLSSIPEDLRPGMSVEVQFLSSVP